jgi:hypothetical protein
MAATNETRRVMWIAYQTDQACASQIFLKEKKTYPRGKKDT